MLFFKSNRMYYKLILQIMVFLNNCQKSKLQNCSYLEYDYRFIGLGSSLYICLRLNISWFCSGMKLHERVPMTPWETVLVLSESCFSMFSGPETGFTSTPAIFIARGAILNNSLEILYNGQHINFWIWSFGPV